MKGGPSLCYVAGDTYKFEYIGLFGVSLKKANASHIITLSVEEQNNTLLHFLRVKERKLETFRDSESYSDRAHSVTHQSTMSLGYAEKLSFIEDVGNVGMAEHFDPSHVLREKVGLFVSVYLLCHVLVVTIAYPYALIANDLFYATFMLMGCYEM